MNQNHELKIGSIINILVGTERYWRKYEAIVTAIYKDGGVQAVSFDADNEPFADDFVFNGKDWTFKTDGIDRPYVKNSASLKSAASTLKSYIAAQERRERSGL